LAENKIRNVRTFTLEYTDATSETCGRGKEWGCTVRKITRI